MAGGQQAREAVQPGSEVVAVAGFGGGGVQRHADPQGADVCSGQGSAAQRPLGSERGGDGIRCRGEGRLHGIADRLEEHAAVGLDGRAQQGEVALDRGRHRRPVPLPQRGAALDVGEEEGDGAGGKIGHGPSPRKRGGAVACRLSHERMSIRGRHSLRVILSTPLCGTSRSGAGRAAVHGGGCGAEDRGLKWLPSTATLRSGRDRLWSPLIHVKWKSLRYPLC